ncbi:MAG: hypothetical protein EOM53_05020 [Alphaproteobacteria bacterium]|nr:hypothetical protein [Alphaproteobacteria bacterium]
MKDKELEKTSKILFGSSAVLGVFALAGKFIQEEVSRSQVTYAQAGIEFPEKLAIVPNPKVFLGISVAVGVAAAGFLAVRAFKKIQEKKKESFLANNTLTFQKVYENSNVKEVKSEKDFEKNSEIIFLTKSKSFAGEIVRFNNQQARAR